MSTALKKTFSFEVEKVSDEDFKYFADLVFQLAGIHLLPNEKNFSLVQNRLLKLIRKYNFSDYSELASYFKKEIQNPNVKNDFISALTTNKTDFFREEVHFEILLSEVKSALKTRNEVCIWSSACSIGAEPYSMAIHLKENLSPNEFDRIKILATDIDVACLNSATEGFYNEQQMVGLNPILRSKYFEELAGLYQVDPKIKSKVHFSQMNLFNYPYSITKYFDVIFCRNVLIYFTPADREKVCRSLSKYLQPTGCLILGLSETGSVQIPELKLQSNSTYRRVQS